MQTPTMKSLSKTTDLMDLPFEKRWEQVGRREDLEELLNGPELYEGQPSFVRILKSQRLRRFGTDEQSEKMHDPRPSPSQGLSSRRSSQALNARRPSAVNMETNQSGGTSNGSRLAKRWEPPPTAKAKPKKKLLKKYERGELVDILMGVEKPPEVDPRGLAFDPLETVLQDMQVMQGETGPVAQVKQRRVAKFKGKPPPRAWTPAKQKVPVASRQPLLEETVTFEHRKARREGGYQRLLAFMEFAAWLEYSHEDLEDFWATLSKNSEGNVQCEDFVEALSNADYPMGGLGAKTLFFFLDSSEDGAVSIQELHFALQEVERSKQGKKASSWDAFAQTASEVRKLSDQDPVEEYRIDNQLTILQRRVNEFASKKDAMATLFKRIWREDPEVAEFMEFIFAEFRSIQMVWRILDVEQRGMITQEEFRESVLSLCSRSKLKAVEVHMEGLYSLLDTDGTNRVKLSDILDQPTEERKGKMALLDRLRRFMQQREKDERYGSLEKAFDMLAGGRVTRWAFLQGLERLHYSLWHVDGLFDKFDRDGSGDINADDIINFLKEAGPGGNYHVPQVQAPSGCFARQRLLQGDFSSIGSSTMLGQLETWADRRPERQAMAAARQPIIPPNSPLIPGSPGCPELLRQRMQRCATPSKPGRAMQNMMSRPASQQSLRASKSKDLHFSFGVEIIPDLVPASCALEYFEGSPSRSKVNHHFNPA
eukprot:TRINITY_DN24991_c0_g1_i1.p1 TRINITY_DN24991_c0_g1~~TRINITY_DN24991_c0_g1_i1.p1  ORF type:complete len:720 (+),score=164.31 TRINITY_DN24991_c0_g1_i1:35-2161(+)